MSLRVYLSTLNNTGVQPQQDLGIPSGWTASVREMKVKGKRKRLIFFGAQRGARMQSAFSPEWRRWAPFRLGLISPGRKVNSESLCAPGNQPEKKKRRERERERKKERKNDTGRPSSDEAGSAALFLKGAFIPWVAHFQTWKIQSHVESAQHYSSLTFIGTRMFSAYLFIYKGLCVMYIIFWPGGLLTFCDSFLIKVGQPENLLSLCLSSLQSPSGNRATFLWSKGAVGYNKERTY